MNAYLGQQWVKGYPANVMDIQRVDKPEYDERTKKWIIKVEISVNREKYRNFVKQLLPVLEKIATDSQRVTLNAQQIRNEYLSIDNLFRFAHSWRFLVCTQVNDAKTTTIWETFSVPEEAVKSAWDTIKRPTFTVDITDNQEDVIVSGTFDIPTPYSFWGKRAQSKHPCVFLPLLCNPDLGSDGSVRPGTEKATFNISFDISPNEFKRMKNIVCRIDG